MIAPPNKSTQVGPKRSACKRHVGCWLVLSAIVLGGAGLLWLWNGGPVNTPKADVPKKVAAEAPPKKATSPEQGKAAKQPESVAKKPERPAMSREEREKAAYKRIVETPLDLTPKTNRIFRTGIEASMARIFMTRRGDPPPPPFTTAITIRDEVHLAEILTAANPVLDTDTQAQADSKEMVEFAKKEMVGFVKNGGDPEEFLEYYRGKLQEAFDVRRESMVSLMKFAREEPELAAEYLVRINASLAEKGIRTIELTDKQKERMGLK